MYVGTCPVNLLFIVIFSVVVFGGLSMGIAYLASAMPGPIVQVRLLVYRSVHRIIRLQTYRKKM